MPEHKQHKRFTLVWKNDKLSLSMYYLQVQANKITMPIANENQGKYIRPRCFHT